MRTPLTICSFTSYQWCNSNTLSISQCSLYIFLIPRLDYSQKVYEHLHHASFPSAAILEKSNRSFIVTVHHQLDCSDCLSPHWQVFRLIICAPHTLNAEQRFWCSSWEGGAAAAALLMCYAYAYAKWVTYEKWLYFTCYMAAEECLTTHNSKPGLVLIASI